MEKYGFEPELSLVVNAKANAQDEITIKKVGATVRDMRHLLWSSIDNFDTEDLDRIEYCERGQGGEILVKVAIADVDAFVPKGSSLDMHAQTNATSVYAGTETFPMLPEKLSGNLTSFPMDLDRLAIVVEFAVLPRGNVRFGKIYRAIVRNTAQLACEEISAWLEDKGAQPEMMDETPGLEEQIKLQDEASLKLGKYRQGQCAFELEMREAGSALKDGKLLGLCVIETDRAKGIVENFMMGANGAMSGFLESANGFAIRRVVGIPKSWIEIVDVAHAKGFELPSDPDATMLVEFLAKERKADPEGFFKLSMAIAKFLGQGEYALVGKTNPAECFCLAVACHAPGTAPNQRYMDLIFQRLLKAALAHTATPYNKNELAALAELCTEREHAAKKVETAIKYGKV